jgi:hypothetical protein
MDAADGLAGVRPGDDGSAPLRAPPSSQPRPPETIVVWAFVLLFGAVCLALALAFGMGSREAAARAVDRALGDGVVLGSRPGSSSP